MSEGSAGSPPSPADGPADAPTAPTPPAPRPTLLLRLRGLPFAATDDEVAAFFDGFDLCTACAVYVCRRQGAFAGRDGRKWRKRVFALVLMPRGVQLRKGP